MNQRMLKQIQENKTKFQKLSEENIQKLGAPKPDIQFSEALG